LNASTPRSFGDLPREGAPRRAPAIQPDEADPFLAAVELASSLALDNEVDTLEAAFEHTVAEQAAAGLLAAELPARRAAT
jgi:hypothetical protein